MNRRSFLGASAVAGALLKVESAVGAPPPDNPASEKASGPSNESPNADSGCTATAPPKEVVTEATAPHPVPEVTRILAKYIVNAQLADVPVPVRKEAARTLLNWVGCAIGGSRNEAVENAVSAMQPFFGAEQASLLGRKERPDMMNAALINGIASHVLDFDDTHLRTIIHPAGPVASALLAMAEYQPVTGADFVNALIVGVEVECRIGNAVYPAHYDVGWHITGTTGVFGAAAAAGKLLDLNEQQMTWALGLAAVQPVGLREMFGSMTKSFHPGRAAQNGLTAAFFALSNFNSSDRGIEGKTGWANVLSTTRDYKEIIDHLGDSFEILDNTYKPFACGVVIHPTIDGCIQLRNENKLVPDQIERIDLTVNPRVLELTGKTTPQTGLEGKFSVYHAAAAAIVDGAGGERQFSDVAVRNPVTVALRGRVNVTPDASIAEDQVRISIALKDGRRLDKVIEHAVGSARHPMSDQDLEAKFRGQTESILPAEKVQKTIELCWGVEKLAATDVLAKTAAL